MDFEAETWDVSEEANELSNLLFTANPVLNVKKKTRKKSLERNKQENYRSEQLDIKGNSNNDKDKHNTEQSRHIAGKNKVRGNVEKLTSVDNFFNFDEDSHSNYAVLNKKTKNKKNGRVLDKNCLKQNTNYNEEKYAERNSCNLKESDIIKVHKKKSKLEKSKNWEGEIKGSIDIIDTEEGTKLGQQPKTKVKKTIHEKISLSPSEEKSIPSIDDLFQEISFETVDEDLKLSNKQNSKRTLAVEKDGHQLLSHSKNKKKRKHVLSNDDANIETKQCQEKNTDLTKIHTSNEMEIPSSSKKKRKADMFEIDFHQNTNDNITNKDTKNKSTDLQNNTCNKTEISGKRKKKIGEQSEYQVSNSSILGSHENGNTDKKRKRKKKDKSLRGSDINDIKLKSSNNNECSIFRKDGVGMEDIDFVSSEDEQTLETFDNKQIIKEDVLLKGKVKNKKLKSRDSNESLNAGSKRPKVTGDKGDNHVSNNNNERAGTEVSRSHSKNSLPFTPLKIKKLLAVEAEQSLKKMNTSTGKQKSLQKSDKQSTNLSFNRSKPISGDSLNNQNSQKPITKDKDEKTKSLLEQNKGKLEAARFRFINEQLYTRTGAEALELFNDDPEAFEVYHKGFQNQVEKWPVNPVDVIIDFVTSLPSSKIVADFGCGDAKLSQSVSNKVHSFDLVAMNKHVTVCDITNVPLLDHSVDVAVFCLSLMGTNFSTYLVEANRVLKKGGILIVAEVASRFNKLMDFLGDLKRLGFKSIEQDTKNGMFVLMKFEKRSTLKKTVIKQMKLKPCVYKKR